MDTIELYEEYINKILNYAVNIGDYKWLSVDKLKLVNFKKTQWDFQNDDIFVKNSSINNTIIGEDIKQRGMFFPIFIDEDYTVILGYHRVTSLQLLQDTNEYLCIILNKNHFKPSEKIETYRGMNGPKLGNRYYSEIYEDLKSIPNKIRNDLFYANIKPTDIFNNRGEWDKHVREVERQQIKRRKK